MNTDHIVIALAAPVILFSYYRFNCSAVFAFRVFTFKVAAKPVSNESDPFTIDEPRPQSKLRRYLPGGQDIDPPPQSHTTWFKFLLYRMLYVTLWTVGYFACWYVDPVREFFLGLPGVSNLPDSMRDFSNPLVVSLFAAYFLPLVVAPLDVHIRAELHRLALIPAARTQLQTALKQATFVPVPERLQITKAALEADDFPIADLQYEQQASIESMWLKASLLKEALESAQAASKDVAESFETILTRDGRALWALVREQHRRLQHNLQQLFSLKEAEDFASRCQPARSQCKKLLLNLYELITRSALITQSTEAGRTNYIKQFGFRLKPTNAGPLPSLNDLAWLLLLLLPLLTLPLLLTLKFRALEILLVVLVAVLVPVLIAAAYPRLLLHPARFAAPPVIFPLISALTVGALTLLVAAAVKTLLEARSPGIVRPQHIRENFSPATVRSNTNVFVQFLSRQYLTNFQSAPESFRGDQKLIAKRRIATCLNAFLTDKSTDLPEWVTHEARQAQTNLNNGRWNTIVLRRRLIDIHLGEYVEKTSYQVPVRFSSILYHGFEQYTHRSWPYTVLLAVFAFVYSLRMQGRKAVCSTREFSRALRTKQTLIEVAILAVPVVALNAWVVWFAVSAEFSLRSGREFWVRLVTPCTSLVVSGVVGIVWFRSRYTQDSPDLEELFREASVKTPLQEVQLEFSKRRIAFPEPSTHFPLGSPSFHLDRDAATDSKCTLFYLFKTESGWRYVIGFNSENQLAFKTEG